MKEFTNYLLAKGKSQNTIQRIISQVLHYKKWLSSRGKEIVQGSYEDGLSYLLLHREKGLSRATIQHYMTYVKWYYEYLVDTQNLPRNPFASIQLKGRLRSSQSIELHSLLKEEELNLIYDLYQKNTRLNTRDKVLLGLLIYQGLAVGELNYLKVKDLDLAKGKVSVPSSSLAAARILPLAAHQILALSNYSSQKSGEELLIVYQTKSQGVNSRTHLCDQIKRELKKADSRIIFENLAQLRRSVLVNWVNQHNLREAQYLAGHRSISSTERYRVGNIAELLQQVERYHPLEEKKE